LNEGGRVIGVIPQALADKEVAHTGLTELRIVGSMHERKALMADLSDAFVCLPGGFGTWEEFFEVLTWAQLGIQRKACGALNVNGYYDPLIEMADRALSEGFLREGHRDLLLSDADPQRLLDRLSDYAAPTVDKWISRPTRWRQGKGSLRPDFEARRGFLMVIFLHGPPASGRDAGGSEFPPLPAPLLVIDSETMSADSAALAVQAALAEANRRWFGALASASVYKNRARCVQDWCVPGRTHAGERNPQALSAVSPSSKISLAREWLNAASRGQERAAATLILSLKGLLQAFTPLCTVLARVLPHDVQRRRYAQEINS
jgi:uncharacterized protein (TIGR00730 family)